MGPSRLVALITGEGPAAWRALGFDVEDDRVRLGPGGSGPVTIVCAGDGAGSDRWTLHAPARVDDPSDEVDDVDGIATGWAETADANTARAHPNRVIGLDHVVVRSPDLDRTTAALLAAGADHRRTRAVPFGNTPMEQRFFRLDGPIVELVGPASPGRDADAPATIWGYAFAVDDIDATASLLGEHCSAPKDAVQPGRRIATARTDALGIGPTVAFMTPHGR